MDYVIPPTSAFACDALAREALNTTFSDDRAAASAKRMTDGLLRPVVEKIVMSGKSPKGKIRSLADGLCRRLNKEDNVVSATVEHLIASKLSSSEESQLKYVLAMNDDNGSWVDFIASDTVMTRTSIQVSTTMMDLRIHRHAFARFMQRERKPAEHLMENMAQALKVSSLLANVAASQSESPNCAIPIGDGLLLGRLALYDSRVDPVMVYCTRYARNEVSDITEEPRPDHVIKDYRATVDVMTYVGDSQLTPSRKKLRDILCQYRDYHATALSCLFDAHYYPNSRVRVDDLDTYRKTVRNARDDLIRIVNGKVWKQFTNTAAPARG